MISHENMVSEFMRNKKNDKLLLLHSSLFYKQPFYKQPGSNSWKFKQFLTNCRGWNCLETKQSDAEENPQESKGLNICNTKE